MTFCKDAAAAIQSRLAELGYYRLRIDGDPGPGTSRAVVDFKAAHGLLARDFIGPKTLAALFSADARPAPIPVPIRNEPLWLAEARRLLGTREAPGAASNPTIMNWARNLDQWYPGDDMPWCGLFVAHCMAVGAPNEPQDFNRLGARQWLNYGVSAGADVGAVCVLWRTHPTKSGNGHVFIVTGQSADAIRGIGGNQSDNVTEEWFARDRVLGFRRPEGAVLNPAPTAATGTLSRNES